VHYAKIINNHWFTAWLVGLSS